MSEQTPEMYALIELLQHGNVAERSTAAMKLGHVQDKTALQALIAALQDPEVNVVEEAIRSLGESHNPLALMPLLAMLRQAPLEERAVAYFSTGSPLASAVMAIFAAHPQELTTLLRHADPAIRAQAAYFLYANSFNFYSTEIDQSPLDGQLPWPLDALRALAHDTVPEVRRMAYLALADAADQQFLPEIFESLVESDALYRNEMLRALARFCSKIQSGNFRRTRPEITELLDHAIDTCANALHHEQPVVRLGAVNALADVNHPKVRKALRKALADPDPYVRAMTITAIENLIYYKDFSGNVYSFRFFNHKRNLPLLLTAMQDPDRSVRIAAIASSHLIKDDRFYEALFAAAHDEMSSVRAAVIKRLEWDLGFIPHRVPITEYTTPARFERTKAELVQFLQDDSAAIRRQAIQTIAGLHDPAFVEALLPCFHDVDEEIRAAVITTVHALTARLDLAVAITSHEVVPNLKSVPDPRLLALLQKGVNDPSVRVRTTALRLIGYADAPLAYPILLEAVQSSDPMIRCAAVDGLAGIGNECAIAPLCAATHDADEEVRYWAFVALQKYHSPSIIPALLDGLHDPNLGIRVIAFRATIFCIFSRHSYGHFDYDNDLVYPASNTARLLEDHWADISILVNALVNQHEHRDLAQEALTAITGENFGDDVKAWKAWRDAHNDQYSPDFTGGTIINCEIPDSIDEE